MGQSGDRRAHWPVDLEAEWDSEGGAVASRGLLQMSGGEGLDTEPKRVKAHRCHWQVCISPPPHPSRSHTSDSVATAHLHLRIFVHMPLLVSSHPKPHRAGQSG